MTRTLTITVVTVLLLSLLAVPAAIGVTAQTDPTTTMPTTTTSTTWVLTGPDGINPDYTSTHPWTTTTTVWDCISTPPPTVTTTTSAPIPVEGEANLLADADVQGSPADKLSVLSYPSEEFGMCADCYTNDGAALYVYPQCNGPWDASSARYLHMTVRTNMPFTIRMNSIDESAAWFAATAGTEEILPAGGYRIVLDIQRYMETTDTYHVSLFSFTLHAAGSVSIGHIALSDSDVCDEPIPNIQTTTKPSFPWDATTTSTVILTGPDGTTNTTPPETTTTESIGCDSTTAPLTTTTATVPPYTSGKPASSTRPTGTTIAPDGLIDGDANCDFVVDMLDAFALYKAVSTGDFSSIPILRLVDINSDNVWDILDAFLLYKELSGNA